MKFEKKDLFTIPNILTYIRFACVPIFLWLMIEYKLDATKYSYLFSAFALFICASITDIVDGAIARNHNMTSDIGKIIDPLADKMLQVTAIIMLTVVGNFHWIFTAIVFVKELYLVLMTKFYMVAGKYQINQHSNAWGKVAAVMVFVAILFGFAAGLHEILMWMTNSLCVIAVGFALFAAGQYTVKYSIELSNIKKSGILRDLDKKGNKLENVVAVEVEKDDKNASCAKMDEVKSNDIKDNVENDIEDNVENVVTVEVEINSDEESKDKLQNKMPKQKRNKKSEDNAK